MASVATNNNYNNNMDLGATSTLMMNATMSTFSGAGAAGSTNMMVGASSNSGSTAFQQQQHQHQITLASPGGFAQGGIYISDSSQAMRKPPSVTLISPEKMRRLDHLHHLYSDHHGRNFDASITSTTYNTSSNLGSQQLPVISGDNNNNNNNNNNKDGQQQQPGTPQQQQQQQQSGTTGTGSKQRNMSVVFNASVDSSIINQPNQHQQSGRSAFSSLSPQHLMSSPQETTALNMEDDHVIVYYTFGPHQFASPLLFT